MQLMQLTYNNVAARTPEEDVHQLLSVAGFGRRRDGAWLGPSAGLSLDVRRISQAARSRRSPAHVRTSTVSKCATAQTRTQALITNTIYTYKLA